MKIAVWPGSVCLILIAHLGAYRATGAPLPPEELAVVDKLPVIPKGLNGGYQIAFGKPRRFQANYHYEVNAPQLRAKEWVVIAPRPSTLAGQKTIRAATMPSAEAALDESPLDRPLMVTRKAGDPLAPHHLTLDTQLVVELVPRQLVRSEQPSVNPISLSPDSRAVALRPMLESNYTAPGFAAWKTHHGLRRRSTEGEVDYGRRVFQQLARNLTYSYEGPFQQRRASDVISTGKSDCGGMSALLVAVMRSEGVPARMRAGRWAKSAVPGEKVDHVAYFQEHVKAEFHADGVGWIPVDLSSAVLHDRSPEKLNAFGVDAGNFITMHVDTNLVYQSIHFGVKQADYLQRPAFWVVGEGKLDGHQVTENWQVDLQE